VEDDILEMVQLSPSTSVRRVSNQVGASRITVSRTVHDYGFYPFHVQNFRALQPNDYFARVNFCNGCFETSSCARKFYSRMKLSSAEMASQTQEIHMYGPTIILMRPRKHISKPFSR
jgi:hypothetical protein